ncbi:MAG: potassium channel family protein [Patescibacteria group bacterium]|nr:potassium channel family protein [Patescibacteria group bacterium]
MLFKYLTHPKLLVLLFIAGVLIIFGTSVFMVLEGWSLIDALYFTVATIMTVGYGDLIPTHELSKILAILYMLLLIPALLVGVGIIADTIHEKQNGSINKKK